jgi:hypothetical protein
MYTSFSQLVKNPHLFNCSVLLQGASIVFGAVATFVPLYAAQIKCGNGGIYRILQAGTIVLAWFVLSKKIPADGKWHPYFVMGIMLAVTVAA